jgi:hypothetical protein
VQKAFTCISAEKFKSSTEGNKKMDVMCLPAKGINDLKTVYLQAGQTDEKDRPQTYLVGLGHESALMGLIPTGADVTLGNGARVTLDNNFDYEECNTDSVKKWHVPNLIFLGKSDLIYAGEIDGESPHFFKNCHELLAPKGAFVFMELFTTDKTERFNKDTLQVGGPIGVNKEELDLFKAMVGDYDHIPKEDIPLLMERIMQLQEAGFKFMIPCISQCGSMYVFSAIKAPDPKGKE